MFQTMVVVGQLPVEKLPAGGPVALDTLK